MNVKEYQIGDRIKFRRYAEGWDFGPQPFSIFEATIWEKDAIKDEEGKFLHYFYRVKFVPGDGRWARYPVTDGEIITDEEWEEYQKETKGFEIYNELKTMSEFGGKWGWGERKNSNQV